LAQIQFRSVRKALVAQSTNRIIILCLTAVLFLLRGNAFASAKYSITGMHPEGISQYAVPQRNAQREYLSFQNELGSHRFIYEETAGTPSLGGINSIRQVMGSTGMECRVDLECKTPAFCTGTCRNMYYEMSNTPHDPAVQDRNHCAVVTFRCKKSAVRAGRK